MQQVSKYMALVQWAKGQVESGAILRGEKFHTEHKLSAMFSISRQTVRQAIGVLEREGYLQSRRGSGTYVVYEPQSPAGRSMRIGVISTYMDDYIFPSIIRGIEQVLARRGYSMQLAITHNRVENETRALQNLREQGVDGIIAEPTKSGLPSPNRAVYSKLADEGVPVVFFNAAYPGSRFAQVSLNDTAVGALATQTFLTAGHRRIACLLQSDDLQGHLRYAGYMQALMEQNVKICAEYVLWYATEDIPTLLQNPKRILARFENCTAVFCYNDQIAVVLAGILAEQGIRVPLDVSLIGVDDSTFAAFCEPPLTSVQHPKEMLGRKVAENLLKKIENPAFDASFAFEPKLVERASVARVDKF